MWKTTNYKGEPVVWYSEKTIKKENAKLNAQLDYIAQKCSFIMNHKHIGAITSMAYDIMVKIDEIKEQRKKKCIE